MEVEMGIGISFHHFAHELHTLQGVHDAERVREQEALNPGLGEHVEHLVDVVRRVLHSVAPILKIQINVHTLLKRVVNSMLDIREMLVYGLVKLVCTMLERPFGKQVDDHSSAAAYPVYGQVTVNEAQHLYPIQFAYTLCVVAYHSDSILLAMRNTCRRHLYPVYVDIREELLGNHHFLMRKKRHSAGLLAVAECAVHNLYEWVSGIVVGYLFCCSHASILSLFCIR